MQMLRFKERDGENNEMCLGVPGEPIEGQAGAAHYTYDLEVSRWTQQFTIALCARWVGTVLQIAGNAFLARDSTSRMFR